MSSAKPLAGCPRVCKEGFGTRDSHQISGREALDNEALYRHVPSIFAREAHDSRSECYVYVPTIDIVKGLRRERWFPYAWEMPPSGQHYAGRVS